MILLDANLLVYAHVDDSPVHGPAKLWSGDRLNGSDPRRVSMIHDAGIFASVKALQR